MVWRICLTTTNEEHLFTGFTEKIDPGDKKYSCEEKFENDFKKMPNEQNVNAVRRNRDAMKN